MAHYRSQLTRVFVFRANRSVRCGIRGGLVCFVQIPHGEAGRVGCDDRLADFVRSDVSGPAVHRSRAADKPDVGRRQLQLRGEMADFPRPGGGARVPDVHGGRRISLSGRRDRQSLRAAHLSAACHPPSHPVTWCQAISGTARRDRPTCGQRGHRHRGHVPRLLVAVLVLPSTTYVSLSPSILSSSICHV